MPNWITVEESLKGRERAVERERERIIKLLEENLRYVHHEGLVIGTTIANVEDVIALIKGETSE